MSTRFLHTKRLVTPQEKKELDLIAQKNQCHFVRRSGTHDVIKGWFEGPGLNAAIEAVREYEVMRGVMALGIRYPLDE